jgi:hypothetical protein
MRSNLENKLKDGGPGLKEDDVNMLFSYMTATQAIQEHDALEEQRKKQVQDLITKDPKTYGKILVRKHGGYDVADIDDIVKDFKPLTLEGTDGKTFTLTPRQFAEQYIQGKVSAPNADQITIDGKQYLIRGFDGKLDKDHFWSNPSFAAYNRFYFNNGIGGNPNSIEAKYGTSEEQKKLRDQLNNKVVPNLPEYQSETGKTGFVVRYDLAAKGKPDVATNLIHEAAQQGNHLGLYVNGELSKDDDRNKAILKLLSLGERDLKDYVSAAFVKTVGLNGRPSLQVVLQPTKSTDKTKINDEQLKTLAGLESIELELNPEATGDTLRKIRYNSGMYVYGSLLRGKPLTADPMLTAAGFSFDIVPDNPAHPSKAIVEVSWKDFQNGSYKNMKKRQDFYFSQITPDELVSNMYSFAAKQIVKNQKAQEVYQQQLGQTQQHMTYDQVLEAVRKQMGR